MSSGGPASDIRFALLSATVECLGEQGFAGLTVATVAERAGCSRATLYRRFGGGRAQLVEEALVWELGRILDGVRAADPTDEPVRVRLAAVLTRAVEAIEAHTSLQRLLEEDPQELRRELRPALDLVQDLLTVELIDELSMLGVDAADEAADYMARMILSHVGTPGERDLTDPEQVRSLVERELLGWLAVES